MLKQRWRVPDSLRIFSAAALVSACSLLIDGANGSHDGAGGSNGMASGSTAGAGTIAAASGSTGGTTLPSIEGPVPLAFPNMAAEFPIAHGQDAGGPPNPDAGVDAGTPRKAPPGRSALYLAFIEDPDEGDASLRLVSAHDALSSAASEATPAWRQTLRPENQAGNALDFAWSPDGQRIALRYEAIDGARLAFFEAPEWQELASEELDMPASQPRLAATANYQWSPDSRALAAELSSVRGPFVGGYSVGADRALALPPVEFSGPLESMAWLSPTQLFVVQPESGEREIVTLTFDQEVFDGQQLLPPTTYVNPLALRRVPAGLVGASVEADSLLYFWPAAPPDAPGAIYTGFSYLSGRQSFVAEANASAAEALLFPMGEFLQPLDTLPECAVVLAWADGPTAGSLAGSKVACLRSRDGAATSTVYSFDAGATRTALTLEEPTLRTELASETNWVNNARGLSPDGQWLALATAEHDFLVDLRADAPKYYVGVAATTGNTARGFSPSSSYLLQQRGLTVDFIVLAPGDNQAPVSFSLRDAARGAVNCSSAQHVANWCGAPEAAATASARWATHEDVAVFLSGEEGLSLLSLTDAGDGLLGAAVSTCGAGCVTQYEFGP
jgi:WD40 repeat protein